MTLLRHSYLVHSLKNCAMTLPAKTSLIALLQAATYLLVPIL
jgi:hypothetical protein